jgi:hypothetical protein
LVNPDPARSLAQKAAMPNERKAYNQLTSIQGGKEKKKRDQKKEKKKKKAFEELNAGRGTGSTRRSILSPPAAV